MSASPETRSRLALAISPVRRLTVRSDGHAELWCKDDGAVCALYGGNKPRKLAQLLTKARTSGRRRLLTVGAAGSHHVLATTLLGQSIGLPTAAVLLPQVPTDHARSVCRRSLAGLSEVAVAPRGSALPLALMRVRRRGDLWVPPGGSSAAGALGYVEAVDELAAQIARRELPEPDLIVVALGSGGTAAGLLAGIVKRGMSSQLVGVQILEPRWPAGLHVLALASATRFAGTRTRFVRQARKHWVVCKGQVGHGYGCPTAAARSAAVRARDWGLLLDPTYTAKAFAEALRLFDSLRDSTPAHRPLRILYWHTLSSVDAVAPGPLPPAREQLLERLLRPPR